MTHYLTYFETAVKTFWNNLALSNYGKEDFTFGQVAEQIERNHILLELAGAQRGDKVVLCARNSAQWAMAFMSVTSYDAVVVPVLNDFPPESVQKLTAHSDATVIFTEPGIWEKMDAEAMPNLKAAFNMLSGKALMLLQRQHEQGAPLYGEELLGNIASHAQPFASGYNDGVSRCSLHSQRESFWCFSFLFFRTSCRNGLRRLSPCRKAILQEQSQEREQQLGHSR